MTFRSLKILSCEYALPFFKQMYKKKSVSEKNHFSFKKIDKRLYYIVISTKTKSTFY
ncbi:hypothetical protein RHABOEDO_001130 [Candidatus Rhabdochlamydia oedothoracis]|uniref:Uncharacterized protein n=1 Tax=Candidatus Rhabdochlamydia oedothoracis TaxID=2720720 RepID=A0ABX8V316_9BACT|nr:hypothetical protein RHOW815_000018 [Candidatus Rhabdochlamydia sp. W815]QYF48892.1 hypothetical protein RHABOEDO_001130 [Candidatus Rhabdochlamydia oedothoracis]